MSEIDEIVAEFLVESYENLDRYDEDLLALERDPGDAEVISSIFRTIHTVKGTAGFFAFDRVGELAHVAENLLGRLRDGELSVTEEIASALLVTGDTLRRMLGVIEETGAEGDEDVSELTAELVRLHGLAVGASPEAEEETADPAVAPRADEAPAVPDAAGEEQEEAPPVPRIGELLVTDGSTTPEAVELAAREQELGDARKLGEILVGQGQTSPDAIERAVEAQEQSRGVADSSIRVDVGLLDELMNLVGELVLARNQIVQLVTQEQDSSFASASQRLNLITTELQEGVMKTRMQPIGNVWNKLPRVVRDLSLSCGKQVQLVMEGQDTELDKTIIEAIKDPLTHLVRNAVDHGIEAPADRQAAGKPPHGLLTLRAFHEGGQVNIEIVDDGGGIDPAKVRSKALANGVITADQAAAMSDREAVNLIFAAGVSTAAQVTNVSGRGVGMDVVRTNIERIGGTVDVQSEFGVGTSVKVKIPLTLAIVPALMVRSGDSRFAIPQLSLIELLRLEGEDARTGIELVHGAPVHRLRGRLLPIIDLAAELGRPVERAQEQAISIVVLQADGQSFGLVVDAIEDTEEIVVKPLGSHLKEAVLFSGATIMGDGRVALILDVLGIAQRARVVSEAADRNAVAEAEEEAAVDQHTERRTLLLVGVGDDRRAAIALSDVERLEEFPAASVEYGAGREVVQYREDILPLLRLGEALGVSAFGLDGSDTLNVIVNRIGERMVGVVVGQILDIVDQDVDLADGDDQRGLLGTAIIQGRVTDVIDIDAVVRRNDPAFAGSFVGV
ncbi:MAG: chemotaxis protein CheA [Nitriliruptoraceae bacterium]